MNKLFKLILGTVTLISSFSFAAPQSGGKVTKLYVREDAVVLFKLGDTVSLPEGCSDSSWPYTFNTTDTVGKEWLSMLLAARATGEPLNIGYKEGDGNRCGVVYLHH
ncbi:hypothetical protein [Teredinibacter purpureus]|uniref:hypothetical protein n=1 Tax=Teredinibacter purpureus TaxID=2731756 RepID=UPI0005F84980|nr:hypothetical protein [Teredinibacter purpureus]